MSFGEKLTKLRKEKGMSQEDLASNLNVSRQAVSKWESNTSYPETDKIIAVCKLFDCSMDELIGLKNSKTKENNKTLSLLNNYFDKFIKGIKMFYSMTFKQKVKCLFEMSFYTLCLFILFLITTTIFTEIIRKLLYILPQELLIILIQIFEGLYYLVYLLFAIYILVKLYKVRYLDYYEVYLEEKENNKNVINEQVEVKINDNKKLNIREEKIIIRDANNDFKPFSWIKNMFIIFCKILVALLSVCLGISFVLLIAITIFVLYFIDFGILIFYIVLGLLGSLLAIYVFIELFVKFIFNLKQSPKKLFIMFILSMLIVGISGGLFGCELTTFTIKNNPKYDNKIYNKELEFNDNMIINFLEYSNTEIIIEDRNNILIEFYGTDKFITPIEIYKEDMYCKNNIYSEVKHYEMYYYDNYYDFYNSMSINSIIKLLLQSIKDKEILNEEYYFEVRSKVYLSKEIYEKIKANNNSEKRCSYYSDEYIYE